MKADAPTGPLAISAVVPCFEEAGHLGEVVEVLGQALATGAPGGYEVVLVSSPASGDRTPEVAEGLAARSSWIRHISQPASDPGYGRAMALGIQAARYPWLLLTDADGQFEHADLARLAARTGPHRVVIGIRRPRSDPWQRRLAGWIYNRVLGRTLGLARVRDLDCAFKLIPVGCLGSRSLSSRTGVINSEILVRARAAGFEIVQIPVRHRPRHSGRSRFEMRLGPLGPLPHPAEVFAMAVDLVRLLAD